MIVLIVSALLMVIPASGGPLLKSRVSVEANWVAHLDYDRFVKSQIGQAIRTELAKEGLEEKLQVFKSMFSFHPIDDIRSVTIYGSGDDREKAVALFEGRFDADKLIALVQMNPQYQQSKHGDIVVHSWVDENKKDPNGPDQRVYGCVYKGNTVVLGAGLEAVGHAVDVLNGSAANASKGVFEQAVLGAKGAFIQVAANAVGDMADHKSGAAILNQTDELGGAIGEDAGQLYVNLSLRAESVQVAQNVKKMLDGMIAFLSLAGGEHPALAELAKKLNLSSTDRTITLYFESSTESVVTFLKEIWRAEKNKR